MFYVFLWAISEAVLIHNCIFIANTPEAQFFLVKEVIQLQEACCPGGKLNWKTTCQFPMQISMGHLQRLKNRRYFVVGRLHEPLCWRKYLYTTRGGVFISTWSYLPANRVRTIPAAFRNMQCRRNLGKSFFCVGTSPFFGWLESSFIRLFIHGSCPFFGSTQMKRLCLHSS